MINVLEGVVDVFTHPELHKGEVFFSNVNEKGFTLLPYQSKRKGVVAYDGEGGKQNFEDWFPVFVSLGELQNLHLKLVEARREFRARSNKA
jgi:hypothetical protein